MIVLLQQQLGTLKGKIVKGTEEKVGQLVEEISTTLARLCRAKTSPLALLAEDREIRWRLMMAIALLTGIVPVCYISYQFFTQRPLDSDEDLFIALRGITSILVPMLVLPTIGLLVLNGSPVLTDENKKILALYKHLLFDFKRIIGENLEGYHPNGLREFVSWRLEKQAVQCREAIDSKSPTSEAESVYLQEILSLCVSLGYFTHVDPAYTPEQRVFLWAKGYSTERPWRGLGL